MADKERRLGRGLESLISSARAKSLDMELIQKTGHKVHALRVDAIVPNPFQPRREFALEPLNELVESLRTHGLMQPIVVRRQEEAHQLIAGERRWRAAQELGWETIDAIVVDADDQQMLEWALIENIQRQSLGPLELAHAFKQLMVTFKLTQEEVARRVAMSRPSVANLIRLLELPESVRDCVSRGTVSMGAARAILAIPEVSEQESVAQRVERGEMTVRQVEDLARGTRRRAGPAPAIPDANKAALETEIQTLLGTKVGLRGTLRRGKLVISYDSPGELDRIVRRLRGIAPEFSPLAGEEDSEEFAV